MAKFNIEAFEKLINDTKESTRKAVASSPFLSKGKAKVLEGAEKVVNLKPGLIFDSPDDDLTHTTRDSKITNAVNWLISIVKTVIEKVNEHADMIIYNQKQVDTKADNEVVAALKDKVKMLETECDEVCQRGLKGNIIISSPEYQNKRSLFIIKQITDPVTGALRNENDTELCCRLIHLKTGVTVPLQDISACHPLSSKGGSISYILRISNRKPDSAWDMLAAGLLTGRNKYTKANFSNDNVLINFQLTNARNNLARAIRDAKKLGRW